MINRSVSIMIGIIPILNTRSPGLLFLNLIRVRILIKLNGIHIQKPFKSQALDLLINKSIIKNWIYLVLTN